VALDNVHRYETAEVDRVATKGGLSFSVLHGASIYTASHALKLDRFIAPASPHGALVFVPDRCTVVFCPATLKHIEAAVPPMVRLAANLYNEVDGPLSPCLFWWKNGVWEVAGRPSDDGFQLALPDDLGSIILGR
jgi:hypothetical protein